MRAISIRLQVASVPSRARACSPPKTSGLLSSRLLSQTQGKPRRSDAKDDASNEVHFGGILLRRGINRDHAERDQRQVRRVCIQKSATLPVSHIDGGMVVVDCFHGLTASVPAAAMAVPRNDGTGSDIRDAPTCTRHMAYEARLAGRVAISGCLSRGDHLRIHLVIFAQEQRVPMAVNVDRVANAFL